MAQTAFSVDELLEFLAHAADRGLMPTPTAKALAVASRRVFASLTADERGDLRALDVDSAVKRFGNKHAKEFTPKSLREYGQRASRAVDQFLRWRNDPAGFSVKTRSTVSSRKRMTEQAPSLDTTVAFETPAVSLTNAPGGYQTSFPIRPGRVVTIANVPNDLSKSEAERLAQFVKMLVVD
jgi:hypothetical protein